MPDAQPTESTGPTEPSRPTPVIGRLAPSPTGRLHLGHARSFLLAWWSARSQGGRVVLRIEDLDTTRVKPGATDLVLEDLTWLGLDWDGAPLLQSSRHAAHQIALQTLLDSGQAYPCVCTRREIENAASAPHVTDAETPYPGTCRGRFKTPQEAQAATGRTPAIRLLVPPGETTIHDALQGPTTIDVAAEVGDFVIGRKDAVAAYQLATPLDDAYQEVTEVLRGADLLPSAARQRLVTTALRLPFPRQIHVPLVHTPSGDRLAKRAGSLSLQELRAAGVPPEAIATWAATTAGIPLDPPHPPDTPIPPSSWAPASHWIPRFELSHVPKTGPVRTPDGLFKDHP